MSIHFSGKSIVKHTPPLIHFFPYFIRYSEENFIKYPGKSLLYKCDMSIDIINRIIIKYKV